LPSELFLSAIGLPDHDWPKIGLRGSEPSGSRTLKDARSAQFQEKAGHDGSEKSNKETGEPSREGRQTAIEVQLFRQEQGRQDRQAGAAGEEDGGQSREGRQGCKPRHAFEGARQVKGRALEIEPRRGIGKIIGESVYQTKNRRRAKDSTRSPPVGRRG
jgi:hypothetical protein